MDSIPNDSRDRKPAVAMGASSETTQDQKATIGKMPGKELRSEYAQENSDVDFDSSEACMANDADH